MLLMTATIAPAEGTFLLAHKDPASRLLDYLTALRFYANLVIDETFDGIVFAENSGSDLSRLKALVSELGIDAKVEFLSVPKSADPDNSRFYLEMELLRHAISSSIMIEHRADARLWKITGRYLIDNISAIVDGAPSDADIVVNFRDWPVRTLDFYLVAFTRDVFDRLLWPARERFRGYQTGEVVLRHMLDADDGKQFTTVKRLARTPRIFGTRGFDGARYGGWKDTARYALRRTMQRLLPQLWI